MHKLAWMSIPAILTGVFGLFGIALGCDRSSLCFYGAHALGLSIVVTAFVLLVLIHCRLRP